MTSPRSVAVPPGPRAATSRSQVDDELVAAIARRGTAVSNDATGVQRGIPHDVAAFLGEQIDLAAPTTSVLSTNRVEELTREAGRGAEAIVNLRRINDVRRVNRFFEAASACLPFGGHLAVSVETMQQRHARILGKFPPLIGQIYYAANFVFKRLFPKLPVTKQIYFQLTGGLNRVVSETEALGRLYCCGFEVLSSREIDGLLYIVARKGRAPSYDPSPSYGPVFAMRRCGQGGRTIHVYKLRTMHPYSEYLQEYVHARNSLDAGGKFRDDFRVTGWGRWCRRLWIDELPMLTNWVRGDLKLVGVRPLSFHYLGLYPEPLRSERQQVKPGLVPPFYADLPGTFDEILESERRYLEAYRRHPWRTDARYLLRALYNIVVRRARSR
jgi:hypothetical protein